MPKKKIPNPCECSCGGITAGGHFLPGHQNRTKEAREKLSKGLSARQQKLMRDDPDRLRNHMMQNVRPRVNEERRIAATKASYAVMTDVDKEKFRTHCIKLWEEQPEKMFAGTIKANATKLGRKESYRENGGYGSEQWRQNISKAITQKYLDGGFEWSRGSYTSIRSHETYYYRSSWELQRMIELDVDPDIESWDYEPFSLTYELHGKTHRYVPDFLVREANVTWLEEVGPKAVKDSTEMNIAKRAAADGYCAARGFFFRLWEPTPPDPS